MSNKKMQEILKDLYLIDSSLKKSEERIISIIEDIIKNQPNIELNQDFVTKLKEKIFLEIESLENKKEKNLFSWQNILYVFSASVVVILLSVLGFSNFLMPDKKPNERETSIIALNDRAFGDLLISIDSGRESQESSLNQREDMVLGLGSSDDLVSFDSPSIMPHPIEQNNYKYVYNGDYLKNLDLSSVSNLVYKRDNNNISRTFANNLKSVSALPININNFTQTELQHFNLVENKEYGYSVAVNLANNSVSIYSNWQKWPQPYNNCFDEVCIENLRLKGSDMLSEAELINIGDNFIVKYGIDLNNYNSAELSESSLNQLNTPRNNYYPEHINIIYPLKIEGKEVFSIYGGKEGVEVSINIREKKVSSLYNLNFSDLQSSSYQLIDNHENINALLNRGGLNPDYYNSENNFIEVELDEPEIALVKTWLTSTDNRGGVELFIPSLIFKIKNKPNEYFNRKNVIIPLIKEIFDNSLEQINNQSFIELDMPRMPKIIDEVESDESFRILPIE